MRFPRARLDVLICLFGLAFAATAAAAGQSDGETLHIPGLPPIPMPPGVHLYGPDQTETAPDARRGGDTADSPDGTQPDRDAQRRALQNYFNGYGTVIGPGGVVKPMPPAPKRQAAAPKRKVLTPAERADAIRKALAPKPPLAMARRQTLDDLYGKLARAGDADESKGLATLIGNIWLRSGSDTDDLLMQRAIQSIDKKDYAVAQTLLDKLVAMRPSWPEAWNKRASVRFYLGDMDGAMADVEHVLKLEPNHFGALEGMGAILQRTGFDKRALQIYRRALAVYPHQPDIEKLVDKLTLQVEGQGI